MHRTSLPKNPLQRGAARGSRQNSIGFLRVALALLVLVSHAYGLAKLPNEPMSSFSRGTLSLGTLGVAGFFALSGFLIVRSYEMLASPWRYLWHRALRIFPGFWMCLLVSALVIGPIAHQIEYGTILPYFRPQDHTAADYIRRNFLLTINAHRIGDIFAHTPIAHSFDDSLWTLVVEFRCYLAVMVCGLGGFVLRPRHAYLLIAAGLMALYLSGATAYTHNWLIPHASYVMPYLYFAIGALFYLYRGRVVYTWPLFLAACALSLVTLHYGGMRAVLPLTWPYVLLFLAERLPLRRFDRRGDFSYGMYIYAFPIQQILVLAGLHRYGALPSIIGALVLTLPLAYLSWHLIEKPCLQLKDLRLPRISPGLTLHPADG